MKTLLAFCVLIFIAACNFDKLPEPTVSSVCETLMPVYDGQIEAIIEESCAYSGCHEGGAAIGDYTTYQSMLSTLESGNIATRVLNLRDMPPSYAPDGKPKTLPDDELELIECWLANGFPEN